METMCTTALETDHVTMRLPCDTRSTRSARRALDRLLRGHGWDPVDIERALLAVTELVANAVVHARSDVLVQCRIDGRVRLDVTDTAPHTPLTPREAAPDALGGRGLGLVATVCGRWGVQRGRGGKTVWCELEPSGRHLARTGEPAA
jgi:anti-sigma regulatory factor (Ser/Thr protein kinase)